MLNLVVLCKMIAKENATQADFDNFFDTFDRKTLGQLMHVARTQVDFDDTIDEELKIALTRRNYLAHQYFWDNAQPMMTDSGRTQLMLALRDDIAIFKNADIALDSIAGPLRLKIGLTDDILQRMFDEMVAEAEAQEIA